MTESGQTSGHLHRGTRDTSWILICKQYAIPTVCTRDLRREMQPSLSFMASAFCLSSSCKRHRSCCTGPATYRAYALRKSFCFQKKNGRDSMKRQRRIQTGRGAPLSQHEKAATWWLSTYIVCQRGGRFAGLGVCQKAWSVGQAGCDSNYRIQHHHLCNDGRRY